MSHALHITGDAAADELLTDDPLALLIGMLLDQQVPMETAFAGPAKLRDRLGSLDAATIAAMDPVAFGEVMKQSPSVHRFPGSMGERVQALCAAVVSEWGGDASAIWTRGDPDGAEILKRLKALPGFGDQKARIFLALLGKQVGLEAPGWREAAGDYGSEGYRSVADIVDAASLAKVREHKKAMKAAAKA
ncbi:Fe-S cluster assembly protein HesB [Leifsonia sp. H3M29-4]|uniref:HhH-GPD-type base excision DNA repair protein n=1 Tax=Salinibacterium metalliresistens TaxID=3031321 RepID=UPI0023DB5DE4|nr:HhH-GPD-type base excision DNA repair protein [Salinibacterium metalliresistens]MDF1480126.1 Fe-S cluster assembly protein HesB [Salinibacterium metalliresistens]